MLVNVYICLPNDGEFEFEAELSLTAGSPGKYYGRPEDCYPEEPAEGEFLNYGPFYDMMQAVECACWVHSCPMTVKEMEDLAEKVEEETIDKALDAEPEEPDFDDADIPY